MPVNTPLATAILVPIDEIEEPIPSLMILPLSLQQLLKVLSSPGGRQRIPRPEKISILAVQLPCPSTAPSAGVPGSLIGGSSMTGAVPVSWQRLGEQVGAPPVAGVSQGYCAPNGQAW